jgi:hypothetical protein
MATVAQVEATQVDNFDTENAILAFLADPGRLSLELPHMTTGQRKHVRRVVDQHPGQLRCESYGFGPERRLYLFKEAAPLFAFGEVVPAPPSVCSEVKLDEKGLDNLYGSTVEDLGSGGLRVKNTFIDGYAGMDDASEPMIFRSMPEAAQMARLAQLAKRVPSSDTSACARHLDLSAINEVTCNAEVPSPGRSSTSASGDNVGEANSASATAEGDSGSEDALGECISAERDIPLLPQGCSVRNTFIHIAGEDADVSENHRVVQSMPHGMFRQLLQGEIAAARHTLPPPPEKAPTMPFAPTPADMSFPPPPSMEPNLSRLLPMDPWMMPLFLPPVAPAAAQLPPVMAVGIANTGVATEACVAFPPGSEVIIDGLLKVPGFNGQRGIVQSLDADTGRYSVLLTEGARQLAKVKGENLRWAIPPPPSTFAAPMLVEDLSQQQVPTWMLPNFVDGSSCATGAPVF